MGGCGCLNPIISETEWQNSQPLEQISYQLHDTVTPVRQVEYNSNINELN